MIEFTVLNWFEYSRFFNENMSLEAMARAGVIKINKPDEGVKRGRGRPKGSKNIFPSKAKLRSKSA